MKGLCIIGAGGHGKVIADIAQKTGRYKEICFLDDDEHVAECGGLPVIGKVDKASLYINSFEFLVAIGNSKIRRHIQERLQRNGAVFPVLCHPKTVIGSDVRIGQGSVLMAGTVVNPGTVIGAGCIINTCASVDHDCRIGDYAHVSIGAHLAGNVCIGIGVWIGAGAVVSNNIDIASGCMIGAGGVVIKNIKEIGTYVGVPVRRIDMKEKTEIISGGGYSSRQLKTIQRLSIGEQRRRAA